MRRACLPRPRAPSNSPSCRICGWTRPSPSACLRWATCRSKPPAQPVGKRSGTWTIRRGWPTKSSTARSTGPPYETPASELLISPRDSPGNVEIGLTQFCAGATSGGGVKPEHAAVAFLPGWYRPAPSSPFGQVAAVNDPRSIQPALRLRFQEQPVPHHCYSGDMETATLGGGCFWCLEAVYDEMEGVSSVESGYMGGHVDHPDYHAVCTGKTGHVEVVQVTFDPEVTTYREILEVFFAMHDPTSMDRQGSDAGTQYRSAIFTHSEQQREMAQQLIAELDGAGLYGRPHGSVHAKFCFVDQFRAEDRWQGEDDVFRNDVSESAGARAVRGLVQVSIVDVPTDIRRGAVVELMVNAGHTVVFTGAVSPVRQRLVSPLRIVRIGRHTCWKCVDEVLECRRRGNNEGARRGVRHICGALGIADGLPQTFVVHIEKGAVLNDGTTQVPAKLIHAERRQRIRIEIGLCVEYVIAEKLKSAAMKSVAARFGDQVDLCAARSAAFCGVHGGTDAEFGDRLQGDVQVRVGFLCLLLDATGVNAIEGIVFVIQRPAIEPDVVLIAGSGVNGARRQCHQASPVAAVERDFLDLLGFNHSADFRRAAVERFQSVHLNYIRSCSYLQPGIDGSRLPDLKLYVFKHFGLVTV